MRFKVLLCFIFVLSFLLEHITTLFPLNHDEATWAIGSLSNFDKFMGIPVSCFHGYIRPFFSYLTFLQTRFFLILYISFVCPQF